MVAFDIQVVGLNSLLGGLQQATATYEREQGLAMTESLSLLRGQVTERTPTRSGRLKAAWGSEIQSMTPLSAQGHVFNTTRYAIDVEYDTKAHDIVAHGRELAVPSIPWGYVKRVHHPGTQGQHMAREGVAAARGPIEARWRAVVQAVVRSIHSAGG